MQYKKYTHIERMGTSSTDGIEIGECLIFPKIDGTCSSLFIGDDGEIKAGSRNRLLTLENDNQGFYAYALTLPNIKKFFKKNSGLTLYSEFLCPHSLKTYRDDAWRKFYVFDVMDESGKYLHYDVYKPMLEEFGIEYIPPIRIIKNGSIEVFTRVLEENKYLIKDGEGTGEGCFRGESRVLMSDETQKPINQVEVGDLVKSYNIESGDVENKRVVNVFDNGKKPKKEWLKCCLFPRGYSSRGFDNKAFIVTKRHQVFSGDKYEEIDGVDSLYHYEDIIDSYRHQAILGLVLSDAHICKRKTIHLSQKYGEKSEDLKKVFSLFLNKSRTFISGKGSKMWTASFNRKYTLDICNTYNNNEKDICSLVNSLDDVGWAYLFMGDGYASKGCAVELCLASFSETQFRQTLDKFNSYFGVDAGIHIDKRVNMFGASIRTRKEDGIKFLKRISKYILPAFRYKLKDFNFVDDFLAYPAVQKGIVKRDIYKKVDVQDLATFKGHENFHAYDIEVEDNHSYFIEKCLVHNCVIKNYNFINKFGRPCYGKIVTSEFKEKHIKEMGAPVVNVVSVESQIVDKYVTEAFIRKEHAKIINNSSGWESRMIPQLLSTVFHELILEETWNFIKHFKNPCINFKLLSRLATVKTKETMGELF